MLPGWCCIANRHIWCHMCAFRFHFWGPKVKCNQASHVRAFSVPTLYAGCLNKRSCNFCCTGRPLLWILRFCGLILVPPDGPKMGPWKYFSFVLLLSCAYGVWSHGPIFGTMFRFIFKVFCIRVAEVQCFDFLVTLCSWRPDRQLGRPFWAKLVLRRFPDPSRSKQFCRWFCFLLWQAGCISVAAWTHLKLASCYFVASSGLIVCCYKKVHQPFAALGDCLKFSYRWGVCGFSRRWPASIWMIVLNTLLPLVGPLAPLDSYRSLQPRKNMNHDLFSQSRYELIVLI